MNYGIKIKDRSEVLVGCVGDLLPRLLPDRRVVVVSDTNIDRHYHSLVNRFDHVLIGLGETSKTLLTADAVYRKFIDLGVDRSTFILAVGGGIVTEWRASSLRPICEASISDSYRPRCWGRSTPAWEVRTALMSRGIRIWSARFASRDSSFAT